MNTRPCSECGGRMLRAYLTHFDYQVRCRDKDGKLHAPMVLERKNSRKPICEACYARSLRNSVQQVLFWESRPELCFIWCNDWVLTGTHYSGMTDPEPTETCDEHD